jgi:phosphate transport system substrate-binding protein
MFKSSHIFSITMITLVLALSCGGSEAGGSYSWVGETLPTGMPEVNPLEVTGNVITAGSSTVFPLSERIVERFNEDGYKGTITVDSIGSGAGFERFTVAGESDISNASRPIKQKEIDNAQENGLVPLEFRVGTDALAVVVSQENTFVEDVTLEELAQIFATAEKWSDVRSSWPNEDIIRFSPGTDSGTFDYFVEEIFDKDKEPILAGSNLQLSEDDNILVQGITGSPYAIGYFGFAYYQENQDQLKILNINGVEASAESVDAGAYPLARPLFVYSDEGIMKDKPQVAAFLAYYLNVVNEEVTQVGYFPASEEAMAEARATWLSAMAGTY